MKISKLVINGRSRLSSYRVLSHVACVLQMARRKINADIQLTHNTARGLQEQMAEHLVRRYCDRPAPDVDGYTQIIPQYTDLAYSNRAAARYIYRRNLLIYRSPLLVRVLRSTRKLHYILQRFLPLLTKVLCCNYTVQGLTWRNFFH